METDVQTLEDSNVSEIRFGQVSPVQTLRFVPGKDGDPRNGKRVLFLPRSQENRK